MFGSYDLLQRQKLLGFKRQVVGLDWLVHSKKYANVHCLLTKNDQRNVNIQKICGPDVSILVVLFLKADRGPLSKAFEKGPARIKTSGPHIFWIINSYLKTFL